MNVKFCDKAHTPITACHAHMHKFWEIILHLSGNATSIVNGNAYDLSPGDILIIPPQTLHDGSSDNFYTDMYIQCEDMDFSAVTLLHDHDGSILNLMNLLHKAFIEKESSYKEITENLFKTICSYLNKYSNSNSKYKFVNELKNELYENLSNNNFRILDYVRNSGFNIDYIRRCFKEETGVTPLEYLTTLRLNYAKKLLLQETYISIVDIAEKCGFNDSFYFSKLFKQHFDLSPLNYRKAKL